MSEDLKAVIEEDIAILSTTHIPDSREANAIRTRNTAREEEISNIDNDIEVLYARLSKLVMVCDIGDAVTAPIRKIPVALLVEIFLQAIFSSAPEDLLPRNWIFSAGYRPHYIRGQLRRVCRSWKTALDNEPRAWSTIFIDPRFSPESVTLCIQKSKSYPLDIFFSIPDYVSYESKISLGILLKELWRVRSFVANGLESLADLLPLFLPGCSMDVPLMQEFYLSTHGDTDDTVLGTLRCPELRSLTLLSAQNMIQSLFPAPMQNMRHLDVGFKIGPVRRYLELLEALPNLVSLSWRDVMDATPNAVDESFPRVVLLSLKSLHYEGREDASSLRFFSCIHAPSLELLTMHGKQSIGQQHNYTAVEEVLSALCGDGAVQLRQLHLHGTWPDENILRHLSHLDTLHVSGPKIQTLFPEDDWRLPTLIAALCPEDRNFSSACPQLKTLALTEMFIHPNVFARFVRGRMQSDLDEAIPGLVTCLKLKSIGGVSREQCRDLAITHRVNIQYYEFDEFVK